MPDILTTVGTVFQAIFIFFMPYIILILTKQYKYAKYLGPVLLCYVLGLIIGNFNLGINKKLAQTLSESVIPLAIPLILFNCDFKKLFTLAKKTLLSFILIIVSVVFTSAVAAFAFRYSVSEFWNVSGMLTGCYTGGTPNLVAIGMALKVDRNILTAVVAADTLIGGIYYFILMLFGIRLYGKFLKPFNMTTATLQNDSDKIEQKDLIYEQNANNSGANIVNIIRVCLLAIISAGASIGITYAVTGELAVAFIMLGVTTLGIAFSFIKKVKNTSESLKLGEYLIYVFSFALALTVDIKTLLNMPATIFIFTCVVMIGAIFIHGLLSVLFRIDKDTAVATSVAAIYGPAFIPAVVSALKNKHVMIPGMVCGLAGYAVGNYIGLLTAYLLSFI